MAQAILRDGGTDIGTMMATRRNWRPRQGQWDMVFLLPLLPLCDFPSERSSPSRETAIS